MRAFLAAGIEADWRADVERATEPWRSISGLRWVPATNLHVTVAFFAEISDDAASCLARELHEWAGERSAPSWRLAGSGVFPGGRAVARVVWLGIDSATMAPLAAAARALCLPDLEPREAKRQWSPHLTLARVVAPHGDPRRRSPGSEAAVRVAADLSAFATGWSVLTGLTLFASELGPGGARHTPRAVFPFGSR
jgi:2'-5' RNA ligase